MNMDLTTGDDFLDKLKTPFVPFENPYADLQDPFFWEEQTTNLIIFAVSMFVLTFGIPGWNYFFYIRTCELEVTGDRPLAPKMNRGDLSIRQWDCGCMGVGLIILFAFFQVGFTGDTFNYMMCVKDPSNITISDSCSSKMCDWQRQLGKGAAMSNVNCLVVRHSMFRTVSTTLLELKDPEQVTWTKERKNRTNIVINGTAYDATKALFTVYVTGQNENNETVRADLFKTLHPWRDDGLASPVNDTREGVKTFLNVQEEEEEMSWQGSMGFLWGDLQFRADGSRFDLRRLRSDMFFTMSTLTSGFLMCCGVWFCESFTFEQQTGHIVRRRWTGLIYPDTANVGNLSRMETFKKHKWPGYFCFWQKYWHLAYKNSMPRPQSVRELDMGENSIDGVVAECQTWLDEYKKCYNEEKERQKAAGGSPNRR